MPAANDPIQPAAFDAPEPQAQAPQPDTGGQRRWLLPALGGLAVLAVLVIFWLPSAMENTSPPSPAQSASETTGPSTGPATPSSKPQNEPASSPWSDAQQAKLRREAQDVLAVLLELQFELQERGADIWASDAYQQVVAAAERGDEQYREREFEAATASYQQGLTQLEAIQLQLPEAFAQQLTTAEQALEELDSASATEALALATKIDPQASDTASLQQRLDNLPALINLLEQATSAEQDKDLHSALNSLQQAASLDPAHQHTAQELARIEADYKAQQFQHAMSEGYAALDQQQFTQARTAFQRAASIQPGSSMASSALAEVEAAATAAKLAALQSQSRQHVQAERWQQAITAFEQALAIDATVNFAQQGLVTARPQLAMYQKLEKVISQPDRLSDIAIAQDGAALLEQARRLQPRGQVLSGQIDQLAALLERASTVTAVSLRSDGNTEVIVYKVARLGTFTAHELSLRPGKYTAVGSRAGYRDVRVNFSVDPAKPAPQPTIICREKI